MPHIRLPPGEPGIIGLLVAFPETEKPLDDLANVLMTGPSSLTRAERELIAVRVSSGNECTFCTNSHAAVARQLLGDHESVVDSVSGGGAPGNVSAKLAALLAIADKVRRDGRLVTADDVERARRVGADDRAIHDTVLIAAMFSMLNRYVDGLATVTPQDPSVYEQIGARIAAHGYGSRFRK
ncbi:MAG TPA: peroxidase-related enzyme [Pirellulales bacterium]|jgi:uncharacterized peroxidase-related enzyme|nr:peroxidase-related enzyme [Pirellulales bacterium]